jgi:hypothetical protein
MFVDDQLDQDKKLAIRAAREAFGQALAERVCDPRTVIHLAMAA